MANLRKIAVVIDTQVELILSEQEVLALGALCGYGIDTFLRVFYKELGESYLKPHEAGLRSLFAAVDSCRGLAVEANECREFMRKATAERILRSKK